MPDYLILGGFLVLFCGIAALSIPWALIVSGLLVLSAGLYGRFCTGPTETRPPDTGGSANAA